MKYLAVLLHGLNIPVWKKNGMHPFDLMDRLLMSPRAHNVIFQVLESPVRTVSSLRS